MNDLFSDPEQHRDQDLERVISRWRAADGDNSRAGQVIRATFDQLYDGQHTGRYHWDQLFKKEKTHFGTLLEINLRRAFDDLLDDGVVLDYRVDDIEPDCKFSQSDGGWMIPPEAFGRLLLVVTASDRDGQWSLGVVRADEPFLNPGRNRDRKATLSRRGRDNIVWIARQAELPPNVLLRQTQTTIDRIMLPTSGQARINEMFRVITNQRIGRNTIATVAQQDDFMKRVRANGGARSALIAEGFIIPGGDYGAHRQIAAALGAVIPQPGEVVSLELVPASADDEGAAHIDGSLWRLRKAEDRGIFRAPPLPPVGSG